ncbi:MAG: nicotinate phosphoribosyltransferase, partial [Thermoproteota archaeon]
MPRRFFVVTEEEISKGKVVDVYFLRTMKVLREKGLDRTRVIMEISARSLPQGWDWGVLA